MGSYTDVFGNQTVPPSEYSYAVYYLTSDSKFLWPEEYAGEDLLLASITELSASVVYSVSLPNATHVSVGRDFLLCNIGSAVVNVTDFEGGAVTTIPAGTSKYLYLTDNSLEDGAWNALTYGAGTSSADAAALAGLGLKAVGTKLITNNLGRQINDTYNVLATDRAHVFNVIDGTSVISLPQSAAPGIGDGFWFAIRNSSAGSQTLEGYSSETINGSLSFTLSPNESALVFNTGMNWITVGYGRDVNFVFSEYVVNAAAGNVALSSSDVSGRMIRVAGTATEDFVVTLPSIDNVYFVIIEEGMGPYSVTFKTAIGIGVALDVNQNVALYCDGTNTHIAITVAAVSTVNLNDGAATAPSFKFALDPDTGLYRAGSDMLGVTTGGEAIAIFGPDSLDVFGNIHATGNISADGSIAFEGSFIASGPMTATEGLTITGGLVTDGITVNGNETITGAISVGAGGTISGGLTVNGGETVNGTFTANNAGVIGGGLTVYNGETVNGLLTANNGLTVHNGATVNGGETVNGTLTANNALVVGGGETIYNGLNVATGGATVNGYLLGNNGLGINGGSTLNGGVTSNGDLTVNGNEGISGGLSVGQGLNVGNGMIVGGANVGFWTTPVASGPGSAVHFMAIGDSDTGIGWSGDGQMKFYANGVETVMDFSNRVLGGNGYQVFPGGLIMQWGRVSVPAQAAGGQANFSFPIAFPSAVFVCAVTPEGGGQGGGEDDYWAFANLTNSGLTVLNLYNAAQTAHIFAIGV